MTIEPDIDPRIGTQAGLYTIKRRLGVGGMGAVYLAEHPTLGSQVAVKIILPKLAQAINRKDFIERFFSEAKAAAALCTEWKRFDGTCNLVNVTDTGTLADGSPFMVLDYLDGQDLSQWLRKKQAEGTYPDFADVLSILVQTCCGLEAVHQVKIVHRDLSLGNLFIAPTYANPLQLKIIDFGIAKLSEDLTGRSEGTYAHSFLGKHEYASPEQVRQTASVDARADIYSLGVIAYRLLCYRKPYAPTIIDAPAGRTLERPPIPHPCELRPEIPGPWGELVMQMMAEDRHDRPISALAIAHLLARTLPEEFGDGPAILGKVAPLLTVRAWLDRSRKMLNPFPVKAVDTGAETRNAKSPPPKGETRTYSSQDVPIQLGTLTTLESAASEKAPHADAKGAAFASTIPEAVPLRSAIASPALTSPRQTPVSRVGAKPLTILFAGLGAAALTIVVIATVGLTRGKRESHEARPTTAPTAIPDGGEDLAATHPTSSPIDAGSPPTLEQATAAENISKRPQRKTAPNKPTPEPPRTAEPVPAPRLEPAPTPRAKPKPKRTRKPGILLD